MGNTSQLDASDVQPADKVMSDTFIGYKNKPTNSHKISMYQLN